MKDKRNMEVVTWNHPPAATGIDARWRRFRSRGAIGLLGTLLVHALMLQAVMLGSRAHKVHRPEVEGPGATLIKSDTEPAETLVLLDLPRADPASKPLVEDLASVGSAPKNLMITLISPDPLPEIKISPDALGDVNDATAAIDSGDAAERAMLFGRYTGQIDARIERTWRRPRSPVNPDAEPQYSNTRNPNDASMADPIFRCQVRIIQDAHGSVQEVQLLDCNGSIAWQRSLVSAIQAASPLPAPPSPSVFTHTLTLTFEGHACAPGSPAEEYELEATRISQTIN
jgi:TonB C terminal